MIAIILAPGFEETEAVVPYDLLKRAGADVRFVSIDNPAVDSSHGISVNADVLLSDVSVGQTEMVVLPGGLRGVNSIMNCPEVLRFVTECWQAGKYVAAICAAPTVLAKLGITDGMPAVCYPGMEGKMGSADIRDVSVCRSGRLITGRAAGSSFAFGLTLVSTLFGNETADKVMNGAVIYGENYD